MTVTQLIREQTVQCLVMCAAGIIILLMYQIFRCAVELIAASAKLSAAAEIIFWIFAAAVAYRFLYYCAYGALSFHSVLAFTVGAILWKVFFYDIINRIYSWIYIKQGKDKNGEKEKKQPIQREQSGN